MEFRWNPYYSMWIPGEMEWPKWLGSHPKHIPYGIDRIHLEWHGFHVEYIGRVKTSLIMLLLILSSSILWLPVSILSLVSPDVALFAWGFPVASLFAMVELEEVSGIERGRKWGKWTTIFLVDCFQDALSCCPSSHLLFVPFSVSFTPPHSVSPHHWGVVPPPLPCHFPILHVISSLLIVILPLLPFTMWASHLWVMVQPLHWVTMSHPHPFGKGRGSCRRVLASEAARAY